MENYTTIAIFLAAIFAIAILIKQHRSKQVVGKFDASPLIILGKAQGSAQALSKKLSPPIEPHDLERQNHLLALTPNISEAQRLYHFEEYFRLARSGGTQTESPVSTLH